MTQAACLPINPQPSLSLLKPNTYGGPMYDMAQIAKSVHIKACCGPCSPPTIIEPSGMRKLPACVRDETVKTVKSSESDHRTISGSCCSGLLAWLVEPGAAAIEP